MEPEIGAEHKVKHIFGTVAHGADCVASCLFEKVHFENLRAIKLRPDVNLLFVAGHKCFQVWVVESLQDWLIAVLFVRASLCVAGVYS